MLLVSLLLGITYICHSDRLQHHPMRLKYKHTANPPMRSILIDIPFAFSHIHFGWLIE
jgi:hypothetical protein